MVVSAGWDGGECRMDSVGMNEEVTTNSAFISTPSLLLPYTIAIIYAYTFRPQR
jgi:hypothetical protein